MQILTLPYCPRKSTMHHNFTSFSKSPQYGATTLFKFGKPKMAAKNHGIKISIRLYHLLRLLGDRGVIIASNLSTLKATKMYVEANSEICCVYSKTKQSSIPNVQE